MSKKEEKNFWDKSLRMRANVVELAVSLAFAYFAADVMVEGLYKHAEAIRLTIPPQFSYEALVFLCQQVLDITSRMGIPVLFSSFVAAYGLKSFEDNVDFSWK